MALLIRLVKIFWMRRLSPITASWVTPLMLTLSSWWCASIWALVMLSRLSIRSERLNSSS